MTRLHSRALAAALMIPITSSAAGGPLDPPDDVRPPDAAVDILAGGLDDWIFYADDAAARRDDVWSLADGVLSSTGRPSGYLQTRSWFRDFELELEWRWYTETGGGNGGVLVHVTAPQVFFGWPRSLEVQLQANHAGDFWVIGRGLDIRVADEKLRRQPRRAGDAHTHRRIARQFGAAPERAIGDWNAMRIRAERDEVLVWINEVLVNHGTSCTHVEGAIALQSEGRPMQFRNVVVRPLSPRARVLLLGDSISMGYHETVVATLGPTARVVRPAENCAGTTRGVERIDAWLALDDGGFDLIHFNFGLHDLKHVAGTGANSNDPADPPQADLQEYEANLRSVVARLEATGATLVFATTTPVPEGGVRPYRDPADVERYNAVARRVMQEHDIAVNDLHGFAMPRLSAMQQPVNVHFTPDGSGALGREVARTIQEILAAEAGAGG